MARVGWVGRASAALTMACLAAASCTTDDGGMAGGAAAAGGGGVVAGAAGESEALPPNGGSMSANGGDSGAPTQAGVPAMGGSTVDSPEAGAAGRAGAAAALGGASGAATGGADSGGRPETCGGGAAGAGAAGEGSSDICVPDASFACSSGEDCATGEECVDLDFRCHPLRQLDETCSSHQHCAWRLACEVGQCVPDEPEYPWLCYVDGCPLGSFCRENGLANMVSCSAILDDLTGYPCLGPQQCGPRFQCDDETGTGGSCVIREDLLVACPNGDADCPQNYYCSSKSGDVCMPRHLDNVSCQGEPNACRVTSFCNSNNYCQSYPHEGQPCQNGHCGTGLRCRSAEPACSP